MASIYDINEAFRVLYEMAEDGELTDEELQASLDNIHFAFEEKADTYARIISDLEYQIEGLKCEEKRLEKRRKGMERSIDRMKEVLKSAMIQSGKVKFKTKLFSFSVGSAGGLRPLIIDVDLADLPEEFKVVTESANNKAIRDMLDQYEAENMKSAFAHYGDRKEVLKIK